MLVNNSNPVETDHVKFISYTGHYPCLCHGELILEIDGKECVFGYGCEFHPFWSSGGSVRHDGNWNFTVDHNEWEIDVEELPEQFKKYAAEIDSVFNNNVDYGCCGGCI